MENTHEEYQYLQLIRNVLEFGTEEIGRNGTTISQFGAMMRFSLKDGKMPLLTTKQVAWKTCFKELMWFIRGQTDNRILKEQGVHIWDANGTRDFLDSRGLTHYGVDELGPIYGYQWRGFGRPYAPQQPITGWHSEEWLNDESYADQLQQIIGALKDPAQRNSRRLIMTAWNPNQLEQMALPPCHVLAQFRVKNGNKLSCALYQRSGDIGLGVPFNIASYSFLTHLLATHCGLEADEFVHFLGDAHIYAEHVEPLKQQIERVPLAFPRISICRTHERIEEYSLADIEFVEPYRHHDKIEMKMVA
jgi:thymidylate synthase